MAQEAEKFKDNGLISEDIEEEDDGVEGWDDWNEDDEVGGSDSDLLCLFCDCKFGACDELFDHCKSAHRFDFLGTRKIMGLDFYGSFKLINFVRAKVAENRCWSCGLSCQSDQDLQHHVHDAVNFEDIKLLLDDDKYLKPFLQNDSLLYSFAVDDEGEDDNGAMVDKDEIIRDLTFSVGICDGAGTVEENFASATSSHLSATSSCNGMDSAENSGSCDIKPEDKQLKAYFPNLSSKAIKTANESYFQAYSSFGIHREMLSDKVRMEAYGDAMLKNPSLFKNAVVMDVGCGTGILSLFAAKAGASRVVAVEASKMMAGLATQIVKDNGLWSNKSKDGGNNNTNGSIEVAHCMVEDIEKCIQIQPNSLDILVSEWMGYCLLYESMLSSVLLARDRWLKPGGAMLPDTATIFVAGFGKGGTSFPFWENVCGFDMSCVGKEILREGAGIPIVDTIDGQDIVTNASLLKTFDLVSMKPNEVDFTACAELEPKADGADGNSSNSELEPIWCYGVVLWFETGFTSRFCRETPAVLSTSPYTPKTHWSQTILTFKEPVALVPRKSTKTVNGLAAVGTEACPASKIHLRISIVRAAQHRSIDISLEATGVGSDGRRGSFPPQIFSLA